MENLIPYFTIVGSLVGIPLFLHNYIFKAIAQHNKNKWKELDNELRNLDFDEIEFDLNFTNIVPGRAFNDLERLVLLIEKNDVRVQFKSFIRNRYKRIFKDLHENYNLWRNMLQEPYWSLSKNSDAYSSEIDWKLNKDVFYEEIGENSTSDDYHKADENYRIHLNLNYDYFIKVKKNFYDLRLLANLEAYEYFLLWKWW